MKLDFLEIGTSDFETLIQTCDNNKIGMSIEPVKYYFNKLPQKNNVQKLNIAISNENGECKVYYISDSNIKKYNLPWWIRGCNSINDYHPTVLKILDKMKYDISLFDFDIVKKMTLFELIKEYNIEEIKYLKIDTEGHDCLILNKFIEDVIKNNFIEILPKKILFEANILTEKNLLTTTLNKLYNIGYELIKNDGNVLLRLK